MRSRSFPRLYRGIPHLIAVLGLLAIACTPAAPEPAAPAQPKPAPTTAPAPKPTEPPAAEKPEPSPAAEKPMEKPSPEPASKEAVDKPGAASPEALEKDEAAVEAIIDQLPPPETTDLSIAHSTVEAGELSLAIADAEGIYEKWGLDMEVVYAEGANVMRSVTSGATTFYSADGAGVIASQTTDLPLIAMWMSSTTLTDCIAAQGDIETPEDLIGGSLAINDFGGTSHAAALMAVEAAGLTTDQLTITQVGGQSARLAALESGSVDAAIADVAMKDELEAQGYNCVIDLTEVPLEYARDAFAAPATWLDENPNTATRVVGANMEGQNLIWQDSDLAVEVFMDWAQIDEADARDQVEFFKTYGRRDGNWSQQAWQLATDTLAAANPDVADVNVTEAYSQEQLNTLYELGIMEAIGIPEYVPADQR